MKSVFYFLKENSKTLFLFLLLSIIFISPQLSVNYPSLVDDAYDIFIARGNSFSSLFFDGLFTDARTWPLRLMIKKAQILIFGSNIAYHFLGQAFFLFFLLSLVYFLLIKEKADKFFAKLAILSVVSLPSIVGNFYRLGTAEHFQMITFLFAFILLDKHPLLAIFLFFTNNFIKETSIFLSLIPLYYFLFVKKNKKLFSFLAALQFIYLVILLYKKFSINDEYISRAFFNFDYFFNFLRYHSLTAKIFLLDFLLYFILKIKWPKKKNIDHFMLYLALSFAPFFIWDMNQYYYHLSSQILGIIALSLLLSEYHKRLKFKKLIKMITLVIFIIVIWVSAELSYMRGKYMHLRYVREGALVSFILENDWEEYSVYSDLNGWERNLSLYGYLSDWKQLKAHKFNPDLESILAMNPLDKQSLEKLTGQARKSFYFDENQSKILIRYREGGEDLEENSQLVCGSSWVFGEQCHFVIEKE